MANFKFGDELRSLITENLRKFSRVHLESKKLRKAAVAITIVEFHGDSNLEGFESVDHTSAAVILTRRKSNLNHHAGQWAFPGGSVDEGESVVDAALRELDEEVHLCVDRHMVIGLLDDFITRSGFHITPVLIWAADVAKLQPNLDEVASIHRIPCKELLRVDSPILQPGLDSERPILFMPIGSTFIASPTAAILYQFREVGLRGQPTRVAHFDQPSFAWK